MGIRVVQCCFQKSAIVRSVLYLCMCICVLVEVEWDQTMSFTTLPPPPQSTHLCKCQNCPYVQMGTPLGNSLFIFLFWQTSSLEVAKSTCLVYFCWLLKVAEFKIEYSAIAEHYHSTGHFINWCNWNSNCIRQMNWTRFFLTSAIE